MLIDGRRLSRATRILPVADLNHIPAALVDRVEVVTGGASAVYGSDAIAGVVNFIMKKDFEGVRLDAQYSFAQHHNDSEIARDALLAKQAAVAAYGNGRDPSTWSIPADDVTDGETFEITGIIGANSPDGKGNVTAYAGYRNLKSAFQADRDFSACSMGIGVFFGRAPNQFACAGSSNNAFGSFNPQQGPFFNVPQTTLPGGNLAPNSGNSAYNFNPTNYLQRPDERYVMGSFGHYEAAPWADIYSSLMFADDRTVAQIAPSGFFNGSGPVNGKHTVNCDNPFLGDPANPNSPYNRLGCTSPASTIVMFIGRRNVEGGPRQADLRHTSYRMNLGVRGGLGDAWTYDVNYQFGRTIFNQVYRNEFSAQRAQRAINVVLDPRVGSPTFGQPVCTSVLDNSDPDCQPLNIFQYKSASAAGTDYVTVDGFMDGQTTEQIASAVLTGDLGSYGMKFPWATDGVGVAIGTEYREEELTIIPDSLFSTGDLTGQGGPTDFIDGSYSVKELFGEARIPIAQDQPFIRLLQVELGYRYSDYSSAGTTDTYKLAADWSPTDDIRFRASLQHAVRAPNINELFTPTGVGLFGGNDPCRGTAAPGSDKFNFCSAQGLSPAQLAAGIPNCPAAQCSLFSGGNPNLSPETSDTVSFGAVFTPTFFRGFSLAVDYYNIKVDDTIGGTPASIVMAQCVGANSSGPLASAGNGAYCGLISRDPSSGVLFGNSGFVNVPLINTGGLEAEGIDLEANYRTSFSDWGMGEMGSLAFNLVGTYASKFDIDSADGALDVPAIECAGKFGAYCGAPVPTWRHKFRATWSTPWNVDLSVQWRYIGKTDSDFLDTPGNTPEFIKFLNSYYQGCYTGAPNAGDCSGYDELDRKIKAFSYIDLSGTWQVKDGLTVRAGINNVFDKDPPLIDGGGWGLTGNANTYVGQFDTLGRVFFMGITADF